MIEIGNLKFDKYLDSQEIQSIVAQLASKINDAYQGRDLVVLGVLNGGFVFVSDLVRNIDLDPEILFIKYKSYKGSESTGIVQRDLEPELDLSSRDVLIVEDIIDSGDTLERIMDDLKKEKPSSLAVCSLFIKPKIYNKPIKVDFVGKELPNDFVIGYGMDYNGRGRSLSDLYRLVK